MKINKLSLVASSMILSTTLLAENTLSAEGNFRAGFISDKADSTSSTETLSAGGTLSIVSKDYKGFKFGSTFSTTNSIFSMDKNSNASFLSSQNESFTLLSEAYVTGTLFGNTAMIVGRKFVDTPFADTDDWGMIKNSFEVYLLQNSDIKNLTITAGRVTEMAGVDAPIQDKFTKLNGSDGVNVIGLNYGLEDSGIEAQGWYYNAPDTIDLAYADLSKTLTVSEDIELSLSGQIAMQKLDSGDDNLIYGVEIAVSLPSNLSIFGAVNIATGDLTAQNGFGGGPFYTSVEQNTISCGEKEAKAFAGGVEYQLNEKLALSAVGSLVTNIDDDSVDEVDLVGSYVINDNASFDLIFSQYGSFTDISSGETEDNTNIRAFLNYTF